VEDVGVHHESLHHESAQEGHHHPQLRQDDPERYPLPHLWNVSSGRLCRTPTKIRLNGLQRHRLKVRYRGLFPPMGQERSLMLGRGTVPWPARCGYLMWLA
jgi:hypothetical protein